MSEYHVIEEFPKYLYLNISMCSSKHIYALNPKPHFNKRHNPEQCFIRWFHNQNWCYIFQYIELYECNVMFIRGLHDNILATMNNPHIEPHFVNHRNHHNVLETWLRNLKVSYASRHLIV